MTLLGGNESTIRPESLSDFLPVIRRQRRAVLDLGAINRDSLPEYLIKELPQPYARLYQPFVDHRESASVQSSVILWFSGNPVWGTVSPSCPPRLSVLGSCQDYSET
jgi:hypothetical protein